MGVNFKKTMAAAAVTVALAGAGSAIAGPVMFDRDGGAAGTAAFLISTMNWAASNVLLQDIVKSSILGGVELPNLATAAGTFTLYAQGNLGSVTANTAQLAPNCVGTTCGLVGGEITYQLGLTMHVDVQQDAGNVTAITASMVTTPAVNFFNIYFDPANNANDVSGLGYGDGTNILSGLLTDVADGVSFSLSMNQDNTNNNNAGLSGLRKLDNFGLVDDRPTLGTYVADGSMQFDVEVTSQNNAFFLSDLTTLSIGLNLSSPTPLPFSQTNPSASIVGQTPDYGFADNTETGIFRATATANQNGTRLMNDFRCGTNGQLLGNVECDTHVQGQGLTTFFAVPEPGTVGLLGLGLGVLGFAARRRRV